MKTYPGEGRKTKRDKKAKRFYNKYKKGGHQRSSRIIITNATNSSNKEG